MVPAIEEGRPGGRRISSRALRGKVAIVTGGTSGIGEQVAKDLEGHGARTIACGLSAVAFPNNRIDVQVCDVRSNDQVARFVEYVLARYGTVDILINCAGFAVYRPFEESPASEVLDILDVNLGGAFRSVKAVLPTMIARRQGAIVNVASIGGELIVTPNAAYCAAKHGLVAWSKAMRYELARFNISVMAVCPDHVPTHFQDHSTFRRRDKYRKPKQASLTVERVSAAILSAIERKRTLTYVPRWLGLVVWGLSVFPRLMEPFWNRMISRRMDQVYAEIAAEQDAAAVRR
jgi:short-subunit dehydrogenase